MRNKLSRNGLICLLIFQVYNNSNKHTHSVHDGVTNNESNNYDKKKKSEGKRLPIRVRRSEKNEKRIELPFFFFFLSTVKCETNNFARNELLLY